MAFETGYLYVIAHPNQKEVDEWVKPHLRSLGFRSRPGRPGEMLGPFKLKWYWWHQERIIEVSDARNRGLTHVSTVRDYH